MHRISIPRERLPNEDGGTGFAEGLGRYANDRLKMIFEMGVEIVEASAFLQHPLAGLHHLFSHLARRAISLSLEMLLKRMQHRIEARLAGVIDHVDAPFLELQSPR
jgi:hypothetical protein